jgi:hypothetical protein
MKYRKKPVVIEALYYDGANFKEVADFLGWSIALRYEDLIGTPIFIPTLEGVMRADVGDFIIKGVNGEFYPCKPDIFEKTYEKVGDKE